MCPCEMHVRAPVCGHPHAQDPEAKAKARQDLLAGAVKAKFEKLQELVVGPFLTGDKLTYAE